MRRRSNGWIFARAAKGRYYKADAKPPAGSTWYIAYFGPGGKKVREAVGPRRADAAALLTQRLNDLDCGRWAHPAKPVTFDDVLALVRSDWRNKGRRSTFTLPDGTEQKGLKRLRAAFGHAVIAEITARQLEHYSNSRQDEGASVSTVRNELGILKHGMNLACDKEMIARVPHFPELEPTNVRSGFFERHELDTILAQLPERVQPVVTFLYLTGWRRREATSRQWTHVDLKAGTIRLDPGETKSGVGRTFKYGKYPELKALIDAQRAYTDDVQRTSEQIVPWVFHRSGQPIKSFRTAWRAACRRTGITRIPHDFRRTAARNMRRAGLSESDIMDLCGWETREMFKRYAIRDENALGAAVERYAAAGADRSVVMLEPNRVAKEARG